MSNKVKLNPIKTSNSTKPVPKAKAAVGAAKTLKGRPETKTALALFALYCDFASSALFYFSEILGDKYQSCGNASVDVVTAIGGGLLVLNILLAAFVSQYTIGVEFVSKKRMKRILNRGQSGPQGNAAPDAYQKKMANKASIKNNAFFPAVNMAFLVMTLVTDTLPSVGLTFHVANATGSTSSITDPVSLINLVVSLTGAVFKIEKALKSLLHLITSETAFEMRHARLTAGTSTKSDKRITGKMSKKQELVLAFALLWPTLFYYTLAVVPFVFTGFSPRALIFFIVRVEVLAVMAGQRGTDATAAEGKAALQKHLDADTTGETAFLLDRFPAKTELECCACCGKKSKRSAKVGVEAGVSKK